MSTAARRPLNVIAGELCGAQDGAVDAVIGPASGEVIAEVPRGGPGDIERAVHAARGAWPAWGRATPGARSRALHALAGVVEDHVDELADLEALDAGRPRAAAAREVAGAADVIRLHAGAARTLDERAVAAHAAGFTSEVRREPLGVVGHVTPWNGSLSTALWTIAPALAAGDAIVLTTSEPAPLSGLRLGELALEILPPGVLNVVSGRGGHAGAALAGHPDATLMAATGSIATGREVSRTGGERIAATHPVPGGGACFIVYDDADLDAAVAGLRTAAFRNAGQDDTAAARVLATPAAHDELLRRLPEAVAAIVVGDPFDADTEMGPLISAAHRDRVLGFVERALGAGATVIAGGHAIDRPGWYMAPTVLTDVGQDAEIVHRDVLGPVVTVQRVADEREALVWAGEVDHRRAASVWTTDHGRATRAARGLDVERVWINSHSSETAEISDRGWTLRQTVQIRRASTAIDSVPAEQ